MTFDEAASRLWWLRRAQAHDIAARLLKAPVPTTEDEVLERLPDVEPSTAYKVAESFLEER